MIKLSGYPSLTVSSTSGAGGPEVLSLEPETGIATVLYSTPMLWEFAYARQNNGFKGDKLFKILHARK